MQFIINLITMLLFVSAVNASGYDRKSFGFNTYRSAASVGWYTGKKCKIHIDHVVSLKDAYVSNAKLWSLKQKIIFSNDKYNHVPACSYVNQSKGSSVPYDVIIKAYDEKGIDYEFIDMCSYLTIYFNIKIKYDLSFKNNNPRIFTRCGIQIYPSTYYDN